MAPPLAASDPATGLSSADVAQRIIAEQTNSMGVDTSRSAWTIVRANVLTLFNGIVLGCFFLLLVLGRWQDAIFGLSALANTFIGCWQEFRAKASLDRLAIVNAPRARVRRAGESQLIPPSSVVLDDLLELQPGDQVPADAAIVSGRGLQVDESMLTGEADPVDKSPADSVLSGSLVVAGSALAQVTRVGADAYANRFAAEAKRFSLVSSELRTSVDRVLAWVGWGIVPIGLLVLNAQMLVAGGWAAAIESGAWTDAAVNTIAAVTAIIPLGLVLMTSITFAVGAAKLSAKQVLVNELPAVEGLARVDVICLDKTGTLTVGEIAFDGAHPLPGTVPGWERALAWFGVEPGANATAHALASEFAAVDLPPAAVAVPFSSARKWSAATFDAGRDAASPGAWVLGAPEMIFGDRAADPADPLGALALTQAASGRRTLVLAHSPVSLTAADADAERLPDALVPVVVVTFRERVRPDAARTLEFFAEQGVGIRIISGDNPRTVAAIAREVGLDAGDGVDARHLPDDDDALADLLQRHTVFGRVTPEQKKRMVLALQGRGHTVAMTGDGVNDALAIKAADIGIAMNSGAPATKAVARLVLLDGQFSHLPDVVREGRQVIANVELVSMLFLTKTIYAAALSVVFGLLVLEFPFLPRQLAITDGLTIGIPAFFLALLPNAPRYVPGFLRRSLSFAIPAGLVITAGLTFYTLQATALGISAAQLRTGATLILAIVGIWVLTVLSRPITRFKTIVIGAMFLGLVAIFSVPVLVEFFQFVDPGQDAAALIALVCAGTIALIEVVRFIHRRYVRASAYRIPHDGRRTGSGR